MDNPTGTTEQPAPQQGPTQGPQQGPRVSREEMKDLGRLRRSVTDRHVAGVAGGLARHLDVDPIILRVAFVVAIFFGGAGLIAYVGAWILVPEEGTADEPLGLDERNRTIALLGVGVLAALAAIGDMAGAFWFPWPIAVVAALVLWFLKRMSRSSSGPPVPPYADPYAGPTEAGEQAYETYQPAYASPPADYARPPRPRNPRKRGPLLFLFTLALIALAEGVLGVVDLAGADFATSSYPALALAVTAAMLLVGAFWGRAGGLIALGVVTALATAATSAASTFPDDHVTYAPTSAGAVLDTYDFGGGDLLGDLTGVQDVEALDGREVSVDAVGGRVEVVVPDGMDVAVRTDVVAGDVRVFDQRSDGFDITLDGFRDGGDGVPDMSITIDLVGGEVVVRETA